MILKPKDKKKLPSPAVIVYPGGREVCQDNAAGKREYAARVELMWTKQRGMCGLRLHPECKKYPWITLRDATFDHGIPRGMGGANRDDRPFVNGNCAACALCNGMKGSRRLEKVS